MEGGILDWLKNIFLGNSVDSEVAPVTPSE
jgi:hypothetical protein